MTATALDKLRDEIAQAFMYAEHSEDALSDAQDLIDRVLTRHIPADVLAGLLDGKIEVAVPLKQVKGLAAIAVSGIWLRAEGEYAVVLAEQPNGGWVEVIREHSEGPFSHIVEPSGISHRFHEAAAKQEPHEWQPTHRHYKGGLYRELHRGTNEADLVPVVVYQNEAGRVWVRPASGFDGFMDENGYIRRFEPIAAAKPEDVA